MHRLFRPSRIVLSTILCIGTFAALPVRAEDIIVDSHIVAATVYNDRATLTRKANVEIPAGANTLIFKDIPLNIFTDSLRAQGSSKAEVIFGALEHKRETSEDYIVPKEKELNDQIRALTDQNNVFNAEKRALEKARNFIENIGHTATLRENEEIAKLELSPDEWANAADGINAKLAENYKQDLSIDLKIRDNSKKINKLRADLRNLRTGQKQSYSVTLPFEADKPATLEVELLYQIAGVSWQPIYDARLDVKKEELELIQYASVWQQTGENWEDINLTLSTAQPSRGAALPDLSTHWVSLYQNVKHKGFNSLSRSSVAGAPVRASLEQLDEVSFAVVDDKEEMEPMKAAQFQTAKINTEGFVGEYVIPGPVDIKADGTKARVLIGSFETENSLEVQVKPQLSTQAFLVAKTKLKGDAPVLPGSVSLFRDGAYIGKGHTKMLRPGDETQIGFGIDDNISITRNTLEDKMSESGVISKNNVKESNFVTRIKNLHKQPISVAVLETVPVSQNERIEVEIIKDQTTQGYKEDVDDIKGQLRWENKLEPQKEMQINLGWQVSWPKDEAISGL